MDWLRATITFGDYTFGSPAANTSGLSIVVKYDPVTYKVLWANSLEVTGTAFNAGSIQAMDITTSGKVVIGGYYGLTIKFGAVQKTATPTGSNPNTKNDIFVAQFDGANVAPPPSTTWTGAANNMNFGSAANWDHGVPDNYMKAIFTGGVSNYPNNIPAGSKIGKVEVATGATVTLPLAISIPSGILNNGAIEINESGFFYGGFNSGHTLVSGTGKIVMKNNATYYYGSVILDNSLEVNCGGTLTSLGGTINGSLILTNGIYSGDIVLSNPNATITSAATSYVAGKITRTVNASGNYAFPVGSSNRYAPVVVTLNSITGTHTIAATFTNTINGSAPNTTAGTQPVTQLLNAGIWTITPDVALTGGSYNVTLQGRGFTNSVTDATRYVVLKRASSSAAWAFVGSNGIASQTSSAVSATAGTITGFSDFAIGIANASVGITLPITNTSFTAEKNSNKVVLQWKTSTEINLAYVEVERSSDGIHYQSIGRVIAAGNSTREITYSFTDNQPLMGSNDYRLKQVDMDAHVTYSGIKLIRFDDALTAFKYYPNPTNGILNIEVPQDLQNEKLVINITDAAGKTNQLTVPKNTNVLKVDMKWFAKGTYFIEVKTSQATSVERVLLQ